MKTNLLIIVCISKVFFLVKGSMEIIPASVQPRLDAEKEIMFLLSSTSLKVVAWIVAVMVYS